MKFIFLYVDKHQSFLRIDFNTLGIKVSYKMILPLVGMIKHQSFLQNDALIIAGHDQAFSKYPK